MPAEPGPPEVVGSDTSSDSTWHPGSNSDVDSEPEPEYDEEEP